MSAMREQFEAWFSDNGASPKAVARSGDSYLLAQANSAWSAWQAACAAEREACAKVCDATAPEDWSDWDQCAKYCAEAIRSRSEQ